MIRFHALRFDSMRRFHHLFQDEKKSGNFKRSFQTNERLLRSIARSKASIAPFQGQYRTFRAILALDRTFQGLERAILKERERKAFFRVQERVPVRSVPEKNFRNAFLRSTEIRNAFRNADRFFRSCPSLVASIITCVSWI